MDLLPLAKTTAFCIDNDSLLELSRLCSSVYHLQRMFLSIAMNMGWCVICVMTRSFTTALTLTRTSGREKKCCKRGETNNGAAKCRIGVLRSIKYFHSLALSLEERPAVLTTGYRRSRSWEEAICSFANVFSDKSSHKRLISEHFFCEQQFNRDDCPCVNFKDSIYRQPRLGSKWEIDAYVTAAHNTHGAHREFRILLSDLEHTGWVTY